MFPRRSAGSRASILRPLAFLACILLAFALSARAQMSHSHQWEAVDNLPHPAPVLETTSAVRGRILAINPGQFSFTDTDTCLNPGTGTGDECPFVNNHATNGLRVMSWSDNNAGGAFGYLDAFGQFVTTSNGEQISHYRCSYSASGTVTLTVTVDDMPYVTEPGSNQYITTYDDQAASGSATLTVTTPPHTHSWNPVSNLPAPYVNAATNLYGNPIVAGTLITVSAVTIGSDSDQCVNGYGYGYGGSSCAFYMGMAQNALTATTWSDNGAGGEFGRLSGQGQFQATSDPALVTHYRCPTFTDGTRAVKLSVLVDDIPVATEPSTGLVVSTYDDNPRAGETTITVLAPHSHNWEAVDNLPAPGVSLSSGSAQVSGVVAVSLTSTYLSDLDHCVHERCPFQGGYVTNNVAVTGWSDGGAGGQFGFLDWSGQFIVANSPAQVTHYRCPTTAGPVQVTVTVDDVPQATEPNSNVVVATYDDEHATGTANLVVSAPPPHVHNWEVLNNLTAPTVAVGNTSPATGALVTVSARLTADTDHCLASGCPFPGGVAPNGVIVSGWSDGAAGGAFGYLDELGQFTTTQDPARVTHYQCPAVAGLVTLTAAAQDLPQAAEPNTGVLVATYDDAAVNGSASFSVYAGLDHVHNWGVGRTLSAPTLTVGSSNPAPEELLTVSLSGGTDDDECLSYAGCPFPRNRAENRVVPTAWSDGSAGGAFGYLDSMGQFVSTTDPAAVTHYQCAATPGTVTLSATVNDVPEATEPGTNTVLATYNDAAVTATLALGVADPEQHGHVWEVEDNLPEPSLDVEQTEPEPGAVIALSLAAVYDNDLCLDPDQLPCEFPSFVADNALQTTSWSDGDAGGQFGYLDAGGAFVASTSTALITHYQVPTEVPAAGPEISLTAVVDDIPLAQELSTGRTVPTYNDQARQVTRPIMVGYPTGHVHEWSPDASYQIQAGALVPGTTTPALGQRISVRIDGIIDYDKCTKVEQYGRPGCALRNEMITDGAAVIEWTDNGGQGRFGKLGYNGFMPYPSQCSAAEVALYECPTTAKTVTLKATIDDDATYTDSMANVHTVQNDGSVTREVTLVVGTAHVHQWEPVHNLVGGYINPAKTTAGSEENVTLAPSLGSDAERCTITNPACNFAGTGNLIYDGTKILSWDKPTEGKLGKPGPNNSILEYPSQCAAQDVTVYRCPTVASNVTKTITLTMTSDDIPGIVGGVPTINDNTVSRSVTITVKGGHAHDWQVNHNLQAPTISANPTTAALGQDVQLTSTIQPMSGVDTDQCLATGCSFASGTANNSLRKTTWTATPSIGQFGYLSNGTFVPTASGDLAQLYRCPTSLTSSMTVTLKLGVDDVPQARNSSNVLENTFDDNVVYATTNVTITPGHQHTWVKDLSLHNRPVDLYYHNSNTLATTVHPGQLLDVKLGTLVQDQDLCTNTDTPCSFANRICTEIEIANQTKKIQDDGGGFFGSLNVRGEFEPEPTDEVDKVKVYRVPDVTGALDVWLLVEDSVLTREGVNGPVISTAQDGERQGTHYHLTVSGTHEGKGDVRTRRRVADEDACGCSCTQPEATTSSSLNPHTGTVRFEVPVSSWSSRGIGMDFTLYYHSDSRADPSLDVPMNTEVNAEPDLAHLSTRNSRWAHTWAQFVEVVDDGEGEVHALWHTGDGRTVGFHAAGSSWAGDDSEHTLTSSGQASTTLPLPRGYNGTSITVPSPYGQFIVTDGDGTQYLFNRIYWEKGKWTAIPYFLLSQITDRFGRNIFLTWNTTKGQLTQVRDPNNGALQFIYTGKLLTQVIDPYRRSHKLTYGTYQSEWQRAESKLTKVEIEGPGSPTSRVRRSWSFIYGPTATRDLVIGKVEPNGKNVTYEYETVDTTSNPPRPAYGDWDGRLIRSYFLDGGLVKEFRRQGDTLVYPEGNTQNFTGIRDDSTGRTVSYQYNSWNHLTRMWTNTESETNPLLQIQYDYASDGRTIVKTTATGPLGTSLGDRTETTYGAFNQPLTTTTGFRTVGGTGYNQTTSVEYDGLGRALKVKRQGGYDEDAVTFPTYYFDQPTTVRDSVGRSALTTLDMATGLPLQSTSPENLVVPAGHPDRAASVSSVQYTEGLPTLITDPLGHQVSIAYNALSASLLQIVTTRLSDGAVTKAELDAAGRPTKLTDQTGVITLLTYNLDDQVTSVTEASGTVDQRITQYIYNRNGDLTELRNARGQRTKYEYCGYSQTGILTGPAYVGQVTHIEYPDGTHEYFGYGDDGQLAWSMRPGKLGTTPFCSTTTYEYDELHRLKKTIYPMSPQGVPGFTVTAKYDEFGRVTETSDATGTTTTTYDGLDRVKTVTASGGRKNLSFDYIKDTAFGRWKVQTSLSGVNGFWEQREDTKGRLSEVVNPLGQLFGVQYDRDGKPLRKTLANGSWTDYGYNDRDQLTSLSHKLNGGAALDTLTYDYWPSGQLWKETDGGGRVHQFTYDRVGQLIDEQHPDLGLGGTQYRYDKNGNRTQVTRNGVNEWYGVDSADKLLWINRGGNVAPSMGQETPYTLYKYDDFGQMIWRDRKSASSRQMLDFGWDTDGRLRSVKRVGAEVFNATYAADGERVTKQDPQSGSHIFSHGLHDTAGDALYTGSFAQRKGGLDRYFHDDWLGSTRYLTDTAGATPTSASRFDAFGSRSATGGTDPADVTGFQYAGAHGYQREPAGGAELGLDYLYQRYYDPQTGRFISRDPIGYAGGLNLFGYVGNDPVGAVDPTGEKWKEILGVTGNVVGGILGAFEGGIGAVPGAAILGGIGTYVGARLDGASIPQAAVEGTADGVMTYAGGKVIQGIGGAYKAIRARQAFNIPCSTTLGANLVKEGAKRVWGDAAHHIVAGTSPKAAQARTVLARFKININSAENGSLLPNKPRSTAPGMYHPTLHTNKYYQEVNRLLSQATSRDHALQILSHIKARLIAGTFPK